MGRRIKHRVDRSGQGGAKEGGEGKSKEKEGQHSSSIERKKGVGRPARGTDREKVRGAVRAATPTPSKNLSSYDDYRNDGDTSDIKNENDGKSATKAVESSWEWEDASVLAYASRSGRHRLLYDAGDEVWTKLKESDVVFINSAQASQKVTDDDDMEYDVDDDQEPSWRVRSMEMLEGEVGIDQTGPGAYREEDAVGKRLRVYYGRKRMWLDARVEEFDKSRRRHLVRYRLGGTEWVILEEEQVQWMGGGIDSGDGVVTTSNQARNVNQSNLSQAKIVMGKKMKMFLPERNEWMEGEVWEFSVRTNRYHIVFDDDQDVWIDMDDEKIKWEPTTQRALSKRKSFSKDINNNEGEVQRNEKLHSDNKRRKQAVETSGTIIRFAGARPVENSQLPPSLDNQERKRAAKTGRDDSTPTDSKRESELQPGTSTAHKKEKLDGKNADTSIKPAESQGKKASEKVMAIDANKSETDSGPKGARTMTLNGNTELQTRADESFRSPEAIRPSRSGRINAAMGSAGVGRRVRVFWKDDMRWYSGRILEFNPASRSSLIKYDDHEKEWLFLGREQVEVIEDDSERKSSPKVEQVVDTVKSHDDLKMSQRGLNRKDSHASRSSKLSKRVERVMTPVASQHPLATHQILTPSNQLAVASGAHHSEQGLKGKKSNDLNVVSKSLDGIRDNGFAFGPNAVTLYLPPEFEMPSISFRGSEGDGERAKLLKRMKVRLLAESHHIHSKSIIYVV